MFGLQWIDRKYFAINSNTTPKNGENQNMKRIEFDDTGKEKKFCFPILLSVVFLLCLKRVQNH